MERKFYENPAYWDPKRYVGAETVRRKITLEWIPEDVRTVCDIGCGNGILTNLIGKSHFAVGMDRSWAALKWVEQNACQADIASVPFADNSFDLVLSTEVIEHLPYRAYLSGLSEIVRIARRYILISVPYCEDLDLKRTECPKCGCRFHVTYHMRSYRADDIKNLFSQWENVRLVKAEGIVNIKKYLFQKESIILRRWLLSSSFNFTWAALCPLCGFSNELGEPPTQNGSGTSNYWSIIKQLWPKKKLNPIGGWPFMKNNNLW